MPNAEEFLTTSVATRLLGYLYIADMSYRNEKID